MEAPKDVKEAIYGPNSEDWIPHGLGNYAFLNLQMLEESAEIHPKERQKDNNENYVAVQEQA
jgi:hypothetical protein